VQTLGEKRRGRIPDGPGTISSLRRDPIMHTHLPPTTPPTQASEHVADVAIRAYAAFNPGLPFQELDYPTAVTHSSGDPLADYLVIELTESTRGSDDAARCQHAAHQLHRAAETLIHVRGRLLDRANSSTTLALPLLEVSHEPRAR
jgi:hypothetical protein